MSDRTLNLQAHQVFAMSLILSMMCLTPFPVHGLKVLSGVCLAALLSVLFISFHVSRSCKSVLVRIIGTFCSFNGYNTPMTVSVLIHIYC